MAIINDKYNPDSHHGSVEGVNRPLYSVKSFSRVVRSVVLLNPQYFNDDLIYHTLYVRLRR